MTEITTEDYYSEKPLKMNSPNSEKCLIMKIYSYDAIAYSSIDLNLSIKKNSKYGKTLAVPILRRFLCTYAFIL